MHRYSESLACDGSRAEEGCFDYFSPDKSEFAAAEAIDKDTPAAVDQDQEEDTDPHDGQLIPASAWNYDHDQNREQLAEQHCRDRAREQTNGNQQAAVEFEAAGETARQFSRFKS
jgi:hypothetical protein